MTQQTVVISLIALGFLIGIPLLVWTSDKCTKLDVETGRRDRMALIDDYGSNRGWYWPWSWLRLLAALMAAPGMLLVAASIVVLVFRG